MKITGLGRDNVRNLLRSKNFPTTKVGKRQVVSVLNFVAWQTMQNTKVEVANGKEQKVAEMLREQEERKRRRKERDFEM